MASPQQIFNTVAVKPAPRSLFNLSHSWKSTCDFAQLIPNLLLEVLPGDAIKCTTALFGRAMPLLTPIMHKVDVYQHFYFVPLRLIWDDYERFLIPQDDETEQTIPELPYFRYGFDSQASEDYKKLFSVGSLSDYFGIPPITTVVDDYSNPDNRLSALPFRAYQLIYNEYYRDQNLMDKVEFSKSSGYQDATEFSKIAQMRYRCWEKDYFTSALPKPQKGDPIGFDIGQMSQSNKVVLDETALAQQVPNLFRFYDPQAIGAQGDRLIRTPNSGLIRVSDELGANQRDGYIDPNGLYKVDFSSSPQGQFTIEMLRQQARLQEFMELLMRGGGRYTEVVRNMFGVTPDDLRIGRPEYLGGGKQNLIISEVLQQSQSVADQSALGEMAGHGITMGAQNKFRGFFKEHGLVIGILSVRPRSEYMQGVDRFWLKEDRYDFAFPKFAHLGEQPVKNGELFFAPDGKNREGFGYQPIYQEYRHIPSKVCGDLRGNLDFWTLARKFASRPNLNADFVQMSPSDFQNIFAVTEASDGSHLIIEAEHNIKAVRCLPQNGIPTL